MSKIDAYEQEILTAFDKGLLKSVATKAALAKFKAAARATAVKDKRVNIRLSSIDLSDIQVKALEEGVPFQALIAQVVRPASAHLILGGHWHLPQALST